MFFESERTCIPDSTCTGNDRKQRLLVINGIMTQVCYRLIDNCQDIISGTQCGKCKDGYYKQYQQTAFSDVCLPCNRNCDICSTPSDCSKCTGQNKIFYIEQNMCIDLQQCSAATGSYPLNG